jgi:glutamate dehydrogenase (NADP+)
MAQDSQRLQWSRDQVDEQLRSIMISIHSHVRDAAERYGQSGNYVAGANIAGFRKVADAMLDESVL